MLRKRTNQREKKANNRAERVLAKPPSSPSAPTWRWRATCTRFAKVYFISILLFIFLPSKKDVLTVCRHSSSYLWALPSDLADWMLFVILSSSTAIDMVWCAYVRFPISLSLSLPSSFHIISVLSRKFKCDINAVNTQSEKPSSKSRQESLARCNSPSAAAVAKWSGTPSMFQVVDANKSWSKICANADTKVVYFITLSRWVRFAIFPNR